MFQLTLLDLDGRPIPLFLEHDLHRTVGFKKKCINVHCISDFS